MTARFNLSAVFSVLAVILVVMLGVPEPGQAKIKGGNSQENEEQRDGQSRHESGRRTYVPLTTAGGDYRVEQLVLIQTRFIYVAETSFGVDYESLDKVNLKDVPLIGSVFNRALDPEDLSEETRVGSVFKAGENTLAAVVSDEIDIGGLTLEVVNGNGTFQLLMQPKIIETAPDGLGELGSIPVIQNILAGTATPEATIFVGGLTRDSELEDMNKVPYLGDVPGLQALFEGTAHEGPENQLLIFITPSILIPEESES